MESESEPTQYVVIVTGSRQWKYSWIVEEQLDEYLRLCNLSAKQLVIRVGDCPTGVDKIARNWAEREQMASVHEYQADWDKHGKKAGPIRNSEMVDEGGNICLAFWDPKGARAKLKRSRMPGTLDTIMKCVEAGIEVRVFGLGCQ